MDDLIEKVATALRNKRDERAFLAQDEYRDGAAGPVKPEDCDDARNVLEAIGIGTTHCLMPLEPTSEMRWAGSKAKNAHVICGGAKSNPTDIYKAMIKAAQESE